MRSVLLVMTATMGCSVSAATAISPCKNGVPRKSLTYGYILAKAESNGQTPWVISAEVKKIIKDTWKIMTKDLTGNGLKIFIRIFQKAPNVKMLFSVDGLSEEELSRNLKIRGHASRFMQAIGAAVDHLDDLDTSLTALLVELGKQHKAYKGFHLEYFDVFYESILEQWRAEMGVKFTPEVAKAWSHVFVFLMEKLKEGYYSPE